MLSVSILRSYCWHAANPSSCTLERLIRVDHQPSLGFNQSNKPAQASGLLLLRIAQRILGKKNSISF